MVDLKLYLPKIYHGIYEYNAIFNAVRIELHTIDIVISNTLKNQYVSTSDLNSIRRRERIFGLHVDENDTIEVRRQRLLDTMKNDIPFTYYWLDAILNDICQGNEDGYIFECVNYILTIKLSREYLSDYIEEYIKSIIINKLPINLIFHIGFLRNL